MVEREEEDRTTIQFGDGEPIPFKEFGKAVDKLTERLSKPEEFPIPDKKQFVGKDFLEAPELKEVGDRLIEHYENDFPHLLDANIVYLWKEKGGESGGLATSESAFVRQAWQDTLQPMKMKPPKSTM